MFEAQGIETLDGFSQGQVIFLEIVPVKVYMDKKTLLAEEKIADTVQMIPGNAFTILDFVGVFKKLHLEDWRRLVQRFGQFGEKRRYTMATYLSNRLDLYSPKPHSLLKPLVHYREGRFADRRRTTPQEWHILGSPWIAVYRKR